MIGDPVSLPATVDIAAEPGIAGVISFGKGAIRVRKTNWPRIGEHNDDVYRPHVLTTIPVSTQ